MDPAFNSHMDSVVKLVVIETGKVLSKIFKKSCLFSRILARKDALLFFKVNIAIIEIFLQDFFIFTAGVGNYQTAWKESDKWNLKQNCIRKSVNLFFQLSDIISVLIKAILKNLI